MGTRSAGRRRTSWTRLAQPSRLRWEPSGLRLRPRAASARALRGRILSFMRDIFWSIPRWTQLPLPHPRLWPAAVSPCQHGSSPCPSASRKATPDAPPPEFPRLRLAPAWHGSVALRDLGPGDLFRDPPHKVLGLSHQADVLDCRRPDRHVSLLQDRLSQADRLCTLGLCDRSEERHVGEEC